MMIIMIVIIMIIITMMMVTEMSRPCFWDDDGEA